MHLITYLGFLPRAERTLGHSYRLVSDGHRADADVHYATARFAGDCVSHADALAPVLARSGPAPEPEPERLHVHEPAAHRPGAVGLLRDLQDLYQLAALVDITWTLIGQAGQGARDRELIVVVDRCAPQFLESHSGVRPASSDQLAELRARSIARVVAEAGRSLTRAQVASLLGVDVSRVSHQVAQGRLFAYLVGNRPAFPDWQFRSSEEGGPGPLPHLPLVVAALPRGSHPLTVRSFMTSVDDEVGIGGRPVTPRDWLLSGGDPAVVVELARTLGEQV